jgi:hypothetical protein
MIPRVIAGFTRALAKPKNWDEAKNGPCLGLPILDHVDENGEPSMISAWQPTDEEIIRIMEGAPVYLRVRGTIHPPVGIWAGDAPEDQGGA